MSISEQNGAQAKKEAAEAIEFKVAAQLKRMWPQLKLAATQSGKTLPEDPTSHITFESIGAKDPTKPTPEEIERLELLKEERWKALARELIDKRKLTEYELSIEDIDKKISEEDKRALKITSLERMIPTRTQIERISSTIGDSVKENTGTGIGFLDGIFKGATFGAVISGLFKWLFSGCKGGFAGLKNTIADNVGNNIRQTATQGLTAMRENGLQPGARGTEQDISAFMTDDTIRDIGNELSRKPRERLTPHIAKPPERLRDVKLGDTEGFRDMVRMKMKDTLSQEIGGALREQPAFADAYAEEKKAKEGTESWWDTAKRRARDGQTLVGLTPESRKKRQILDRIQTGVADRVSTVITSKDYTYQGNDPNLTKLVGKKLNAMAPEERALVMAYESRKAIQDMAASDQEHKDDPMYSVVALSFPEEMRKKVLEKDQKNEIPWFVSGNAELKIVDRVVAPGTTLDNTALEAKAAEGIAKEIADKLEQEFKKPEVADKITKLAGKPLERKHFDGIGKALAPAALAAGTKDKDAIVAMKGGAYKEVAERFRKALKDPANKVRFNIDGVELNDAALDVLADQMAVKFVDGQLGLKPEEVKKYKESPEYKEFERDMKKHENDAKKGAVVSVVEAELRDESAMLQEVKKPGTVFIDDKGHPENSTYRLLAKAIAPVLEPLADGKALTSSDEYAKLSDNIYDKLKKNPHAQLHFNDAAIHAIADQVAVRIMHKQLGVSSRFENAGPLIPNTNPSPEQEKAGIIAGDPSKPEHFYVLRDKVTGKNIALLGKFEEDGKFTVKGYQVMGEVPLKYYAYPQDKRPKISITSTADTAAVFDELNKREGFSETMRFSLGEPLPNGRSEKQKEFLKEQGIPVTDAQTLMQVTDNKTGKVVNLHGRSESNGSFVVTHYEVMGSTPGQPGEYHKLDKPMAIFSPGSREQFTPVMDEIAKRENFKDGAIVPPPMSVKFANEMKARKIAAAEAVIKGQLPAELNKQKAELEIANGGPLRPEAIGQINDAVSPVLAKYMADPDALKAMDDKQYTQFIKEVQDALLRSGAIDLPSAGRPDLIAFNITTQSVQKKLGADAPAPPTQLLRESQQSEKTLIRQTIRAQVRGELLPILTGTTTLGGPKAGSGTPNTIIANVIAMDSAKSGRVLNAEAVTDRVEAVMTKYTLEYRQTGKVNEAALERDLKVMLSDPACGLGDKALEKLPTMIAQSSAKTIRANGAPQAPTDYKAVADGLLDELSKSCSKEFNDAIVQGNKDSGIEDGWAEISAPQWTADTMRDRMVEIAKGERTWDGKMFSEMNGDPKNQGAFMQWETYTSLDWIFKHGTKENHPESKKQVLAHGTRAALIPLSPSDGNKSYPPKPTIDWRSRAITGGMRKNEADALAAGLAASSPESPLYQPVIDTENRLKAAEEARTKNEYNTRDFEEAYQKTPGYQGLLDKLKAAEAEYNAAPNGPGKLDKMLQCRLEMLNCKLSAIAKLNPLAKAVANRENNLKALEGERAKNGYDAKDLEEAYKKDPRYQALSDNLKAAQEAFDAAPNAIGKRDQLLQSKLEMLNYKVQAIGTLPPVKVVAPFVPPVLPPIVTPPEDLPPVLPVSPRGFNFSEKDVLAFATTMPKNTDDPNRPTGLTSELQVPTLGDGRSNEKTFGV